MTKINKHIEIAASTRVGQRTMAIQTTEMIKEALEKFFIRVNISIINTLEDLERLVEKQPDLVFVGVKRLHLGRQSLMSDKYIKVSEYFEDRGTVVTGSGSSAIELERSKTKAKEVVSASGLTTPPYFITENGQYTDEFQLPFGFPMFLKPHNRGGGHGIDNDSVVHNFDEFEAKIISLEADGTSKVLVENYLPGREFTVAVLQNPDKDGLITMPVEIIPRLNSDGDRVLSRSEKQEDAEEIIMIQDVKLKDTISVFAKDIFNALGARDYGRIDIKLDENGEPNFLEANLVPGLSNGYFRKAVELNDGQSYEDMILHIANLAFSH